MANVVNKPGWVGSSAVSVTGQRWMSAAMNALKVSRPANMSAMCGRGMDTFVTPPGVWLRRQWILGPMAGKPSAT
ncbi:hypothetical protein [Escherichia coli]|uniref:hypothetical protein n=1 Tax=Escherichia coli TaxID=562 RepID=UPI002994F360|nr:hypothetical protein [Escherichia coli]HBB3300059.1 hypothetical protein [Escherichia coli]